MIEDKRKNVYETPDSSIKHAVVLVSGGMDSRVCLQRAVKLYGSNNVVAVSAYYGQKNPVEMEYAEINCKKLNVRRIEMNLSPIFSINKNYSSYIQGSDKEIENDTYENLMKAKIEKGESPVSDEYIPNRNSLLLNVVCSIGLQLFNNEKFTIITGVHCDDAKTVDGSQIQAYPDTSLAFVNATNIALQEATASICYVYAPLANMTKTEVAIFGIENGMVKDDFKSTWSCYHGRSEEHHNKECGNCCPTCYDKVKALVVGAGYTVEDVMEQFDVKLEDVKSLFSKN